MRTLIDVILYDIYGAEVKMLNHDYFYQEISDDLKIIVDMINKQYEKKNNRSTLLQLCKSASYTSYGENILYDTKRRFKLTEDERDELSDKVDHIFNTFSSVGYIHNLDKFDEECFFRNAVRRQIARSIYKYLSDEDIEYDMYRDKDDDSEDEYNDESLLDEYLLKN